MKNFLIYGILSILLCGCVGNSIETRVAAKANPQKVCSVAILPFDNWTRQLQAGVIMQRVFHGAMVNSQAVSVRPEGDVSLFRLRHRLLPGALLESFHFSDLREKLEVDAVVQGRLTEAGVVSGRGGEETPFIAIQMDLYDVERGRLVLSTIHKRWGNDYRKVMHFGTVTTVTGLMSKVSEEIIADWLEKGVGDCQ